MREVVDSRKPDLVNFVTIAEKDEEGLVRKSRPRNVEISGKEKEFLIATTSEPLGESLISVFEVRKEGNGVVVTNALESDDGEVSMTIRDNQLTSTEVFRRRWR